MTGNELNVKAQIYKNLFRATCQWLLIYNSNICLVVDNKKKKKNSHYCCTRYFGLFACCCWCIDHRSLRTKILMELFVKWRLSGTESNVSNWIMIHQNILLFLCICKCTYLYLFMIMQVGIYFDAYICIEVKNTEKQLRYRFLRSNVKTFEQVDSREQKDHVLHYILYRIYWRVNW